MATNTLVDRADGQTITQSFFNDIHQAFQNDFVGRDSSGVAASGKNLGTAALPWGSVRANSFISGGSALDTSQVAAPPYRVISGKVRTTSNQPAFITPDGVGGGPDFSIQAATTNLIYSVNGTSYTLTSNLTKTGLSLAPSTNNTALIAGSYPLALDTKTIGEVDDPFYPFIAIGTVGTEISTLAGTYQCFKVVSGGNTEYFMAFIEDATSLTKCLRGFFYNSSLAPINPIGWSAGDTITLMKQHYVFLDSDLSTIDTTTKTPHYGASSPSSPVTGDYWYDMANSLWKRYDGATFVTVTRTLIGVVLVDTADAVAARCMDFDKRYRSDSGVQLKKFSTEIIELASNKMSIHVAGNELNFQWGRLQWNITTDRATGADMFVASEQASAYYYLYLSDTGQSKISDIPPVRRPDLFGYYHRHNPWRCVGWAYNNGSSNLMTVIPIGVTETQWETYTVSILSIGGTNPTKGTTTVDQGRYRVSGTDLEVRYDYVQTGAGASGTQSYRFSLPDGIYIDTTIIGETNAANSSRNVANVGTASWDETGGGNDYFGICQVYDQSYLTASGIGGGGGTTQIGVGTSSLGAADVHITLHAKIPVGHLKRNAFGLL